MRECWRKFRSIEQAPAGLPSLPAAACHNKRDARPSGRFNLEDDEEGGSPQRHRGRRGSTEFNPLCPLRALCVSVVNRLPLYTQVEKKNPAGALAPLGRVSGGLMRKGGLEPPRVASH